MHRRWLSSAVASLALTGCGSEAELQPVQQDPPMEPPDCAATELQLADGSCVPVGVPPDGCAEGFEHLEDGCYPVLPPERCPPGLMAIPGDAACREVASCGDGTWGDIPIEPSTVFVDGSYTGGGSDGTEAHPFTTVAEAVTVAPSGTMIAIAAGSYAGEVEVEHKALRLWGRCPAMVEIVAEPGDTAALALRQGSDGSEVHTLALRGDGMGLALGGATGLSADRVWVHDTARFGVAIYPAPGPPAATVTGSLVENTAQDSISMQDGTAVVQDCHVRGTAGTSPNGGWGIIGHASSADSSLSVSRSLVEGVHFIGIGTVGGVVEVQGSVVRHVQHIPGFSARGIGGLPEPPRRSTITARQCLVEHVQGPGVDGTGSDLLVEHSVVQHGDAVSAEHQAMGIVLQPYPPSGDRAVGIINTSVIQNASTMGLHVGGGEVLVDQTVVRDTRAGVIPEHGWGFAVSQLADLQEPSRGTILRSRADWNNGVGIVVLGSTATIQDVEVRDTQSAEGITRGHGIVVTVVGSTLVRSSATITDVTIERSTQLGLMVSGADATIERLLVRDTAETAEGSFGDGVVSLGWFADATIHLTDSRIENQTRAGVAAFGANMSVGNTVLECNPIDLNGETYEDKDFAFVNLGGNQCGCDGQHSECQLSSSGLAPPDPTLPPP